MHEWVTPAEFMQRLCRTREAMRRELGGRRRTLALPDPPAPPRHPRRDGTLALWHHDGRGRLASHASPFLLLLMGLRLALILAVAAALVLELLLPTLRRGGSRRSAISLGEGRSASAAPPRRARRRHRRSGWARVVRLRAEAISPGRDPTACPAPATGSNRGRPSTPRPARRGLVGRRRGRNHRARSARPPCRSPRWSSRTAWRWRRPGRRSCPAAGSDRSWQCPFIGGNEMARPFPRTPGEVCKVSRKVAAGRGGRFAHAEETAVTSASACCARRGRVGR